MCGLLFLLFFRLYLSLSPVARTKFEAAPNTQHYMRFDDIVFNKCTLCALHISINFAVIIEEQKGKRVIQKGREIRKENEEERVIERINKKILLHNINCCNVLFAALLSKNYRFNF